MSKSTLRFLADTAERAAKTFAQAFFAVWLGIGGAQFDTLFTVDNLKAGVVGLALSVATSLGSKKLGADDSASLLPASIDPPQKKKAAANKAAARHN